MQPGNTEYTVLKAFFAFLLQIAATFQNVQLLF